MSDLTRFEYLHCEGRGFEVNNKKIFKKKARKEEGEKSVVPVFDLSPIQINARHIVSDVIRPSLSPRSPLSFALLD